MPFCHNFITGTHIATYRVKLESKSTTAEAESRGFGSQTKERRAAEYQGGKQRRRAKAKSTIKNLKFNNLK